MKYILICMFCYIKDRNVIRGVEREYQQCNMSGKTLKHFAIDVRKCLDISTSHGMI
ncbi:hypothetical protein CWI39_1113p0010 [Hamiltosporidium magnivora]|uniref:Uncharacterized protein n=1 Tax=Hamiltosporidium magnivora TaxID=148818 RepID=A0A4Q9L5Y1_9MICR|nr:hypothetical protein CWI39_1113p0010 [Hamiltosporidium magnivora]